MDDQNTNVNDDDMVVEDEKETGEEELEIKAEGGPEVVGAGDDEDDEGDFGPSSFDRDEDAVESDGGSWDDEDDDEDEDEDM
jgi:hypothetical protein